MLPSDIVDLDRYPLHGLDGPTARELITSCQQSLEDKALCRLPGFIRQDIIESMAEEGAALTSVAYSYETNRCAYDDADDSFPDSHPRNQTHFCRYRQVLNHQISNDSGLRLLYMWPALTEFLRRALNIDSLYQSACPHLALTLQIAQTGDENGWHFDGNDFVVSILLQAPDYGGEFEYAPNIRTKDDERYDAISRVIAEPDKFAERPAIAPGTLTLFKGDLSLHRVRKIGETVSPRIIALFSYDEQPGQVFLQSYIDEVRGFDTSSEISAS